MKNKKCAFKYYGGGGVCSLKAQKLLEKPGKYYLGQMVAENGIFYKLFLSAILTLRKIKFFDYLLQIK